MSEIDNGKRLYIIDRIVVERKNVAFLFPIYFFVVPEYFLKGTVWRGV